MPGAYVFDAYGTLFDVHSAVARLAAEIGPGADRLSALWRTKQLEYTWVLALAGRHAGFRELTRQALDFAIASTAPGLPQSLRDRLLEAYGRLDAYPDVAPALARLRSGGRRLAVLSNGDPDMLSEALAASGLGGALDLVLSVAEAGVFKPDRRVYRLATVALGLPADEIGFVSSNRWDIAGARAFGMRPVWLNRSGQPEEYPDLVPERVIGGLGEL